MRSEDIFSNIDDRTAERLSEEYPVLDEKRKARLYAMSKRKFDMDNVPETELTEVSGVEKYNRPRWYKGASIAAAAVLLVAGIGTSTVLISKNGKGPAAQVSEVTSAQVAENTALTSAAAVAATEAPTEGAVDYDAVAKELTNAFLDFGNDLYMGKIQADKTDIITKSIGTDTGPMFDFYRVTDPRYPDWKAVEKRCFEIFDEKRGKQVLEDCKHTDEANIKEGSMFCSANGILYCSASIYDANITLPDWDKDTVDCTQNPDGTLTAVRTKTYKDNTPSYTQKTVFTFVNTENGWRISEFEESIIGNSSQAQENVDADAVAKELTDAYAEFLSDLHGGAIEVDKENIVIKKYPAEVDGFKCKEYYRVTDKKYLKWADVEKRCFEIFDTEFGKLILENCNCVDEADLEFGGAMYKTSDGLYIERSIFDDNNGIVNWDQKNVTGILKPDGTISTTLTRTVTTTESPYTLKVDFTFVNTENGWRISKATEQFAD